MNRLLFAAALAGSLAVSFAAAMPAFAQSKPGNTASEAGAAASDDSQRPASKPVLTVTGLVKDGKVVFDKAALKALPKTSFVTATAWTEGMQTYEGVSLKDLLQAVGSTGTTLRIIAINDYATEVPVSDVALEPIFAMSQDGKPLAIRDKGPLWLLYPMSKLDMVKDASLSAKSIWQIKAIEIR